MTDSGRHRDGGVIYVDPAIDTYLFVHPRTAAGDDGGGLSTGAIVGIVIAAVAARRGNEGAGCGEGHTPASSCLAHDPSRDCFERRD